MNNVDWEKVIFFKGIDNPSLADRFIGKLREYVGQTLQVQHINYRRFVDKEFDDVFADRKLIQNKTVVFFECLKDLETTMRFLQMCWAAKKKYGAKRIVAVISFMHYRRQDRPEKEDEIHRSEWLAEMLKCNGVDHVVVATPHSKQIQKNCEKYGLDFWAVDPSEAFASILRPLLPEPGDGQKAAVYSPDEGSIPRAISLAKFLNVSVFFNLKDRGLDNETSMAEVDKERIEEIIRKYSEEYDFTDLHYATPEIVKGIYIIMVEDEVDTGGTSNRQGKILRKYGAKAVLFCGTHPVLSDGWERKLFAGNPFTKIIMCDTIERGAEKRTGGRIHDVSIAGPIASLVYRVLQNIFGNNSKE